MKQFFYRIVFELKRVSPLCIILPICMLLTEAVIVVFDGGTTLLYRAADNKGFFPGPFVYYILYSVRIIISGVLFGICLSGKRIYEKRARMILYSAIICFALMTEYKLIFVSIRLMAAFTLTAVSALMGLFICKYAGNANRKTCVLSLFLSVMEIISAVQLLSLILHI